MNAKLKVLACMLLTLGCATSASAATSVSGAIAGETWTKLNSPYLVVGNVSVAALTIQPGVTIMFMGNYGFEIAGGISAIGTGADPIIFTRTNAVGGWQGIFFNENPFASELANCRIERSVNSGIRVTNSTPVIRDCVIANNSGLFGGGLRIANNQPVVLTRCVVTNNTATAGDGGGIFLDAPSASLVGCTVVSNRAVFGGGGIRFLRLTGTRLTVIDCNITGNIASGGSQGWGGGIFFRGGNLGILEIHRSVIRGNSALGLTESIGGGVHFTGVGIFETTLFNSNTADRKGAGVFGDCNYVPGQRLTMTNCVVSNNRGHGITIEALETTGSAVVNCTVAYNTNSGLSVLGSATAINSIFWANFVSQLAGSVSPSYCDVQGGALGIGNIAINPVFSSLSAFTLFAASPCVDSGNPNPSFNDGCFPPSLGTVTNDMGAYGGPSACAWPIAPRITTQPRSQVNCVGHSVTFGTSALGEPPLTYQWQFNGGDINDATNASYTISNLQSNHAGLYSVRVTNMFGVATSDPASLTVNPVCVAIDLYAGLTIGGVVGQTYRVDYVTQLAATNQWSFLTNVFQATPEVLWVDPHPATLERRIYRVLPQP